MSPLLAKADLNDTSGDLALTLVIVGVISLAAILGLLSVRIARIRASRYADFLTAAGIVWACCAAGSGVTTALAQFQFASEQKKMMANGFLDIAVRTPAPPLPWNTWAGLALAYGILVFFAARAKSTEPPPE